MRYEVSLEFEACIYRLFPTMHPDQASRLHKFLINHERKQACINRLCEQIEKAEQSANLGGKFERTRFDAFIDTTVRMFANAATQHEHEKSLSGMEKRRLEDGDNYIKELEAEQDELQKELESGKLVSYPKAN